MTSRTKLTNFARNIALVLASLVLVLGFWEIFLRFYNPLGFRIRGDKIILPINKKEIIRHEGGLGKLDPVVVHQRNSLGFRGPEPPADLARRLIVVTVGGSTTECFDLAEDKTWPAQLARLLARVFPNLWLNNAGLSGNSTFGHYVLLQDYLVKLRPQVLIFLVGVNDIGISGEKDFDQRLHQVNVRSLERLLASLAVKSEVAAVLVNLYRYYFPKAVTMANQQDPQELDFTKLQDLDVAPGAREALKQLHAEKFVPGFKQRLEKLLGLARQHGITPVLLTQPVLYGPVTDPESGVDLTHKLVARDMDGQTGWEVLELYNDTTRQVGREQGVLVIDLARQMPKDSRYYYDLMHYTNDGAQLMAELIYRQLSPFLVKNFGAGAAIP